VVKNTTQISNTFIEEYFHESGDSIRVYLYGLYMCGSANRYDNTLEHFAQKLLMSTDDIKQIFIYWSGLGLVNILSSEPFIIEYLPVKTGMTKIKKYSENKYADFNSAMNAVITGRMITPKEYHEYYGFIESKHFEPEALIMVAKYCVGLKGADISYGYILTVAGNWAIKGIRTVEAVEEKLKDQTDQSNVITAVLKNLGSKRIAEPGDFELLAKWLDMGYSASVIEKVAKSVRGSIQKLDTAIMKYFEHKLFEQTEIDNFQKTSKDLVTFARELNKKIGVYYEMVDPIVTEYIIPWTTLGFDRETLLYIAGHCFKTSRRTLADMDNLIQKFYKQGITTIKAIHDMLNEHLAVDGAIKKLLESLDLSRGVAHIDRDFYGTWTNEWNFTTDIIDHVATLAKGKTSPMAYMNKILASYREKKITTLESAKKDNYAPPTLTVKQNYTKHNYTDEQYKSLFKSLDEVKY